jgi:hypothetical protein
MLIKGEKLNRAQREQVLAAFVHRHLDMTTKTDDEWLNTHAFHFVKDGSRLMRNRRYAEPAFMAEEVK